MIINRATFTGHVSLVESQPMLKKDTRSEPVKLPLIRGVKLSDESWTQVLKGGRMKLSGRLAMVRRTGLEYKTGTLEAALEKAKAGDVPGAEVLRKALAVHAADFFLAQVVVDELDTPGAESVNVVQLLAEVREFGQQTKPFTTKGLTNASKFSLLQPIKPKAVDEPGQTMYFRCYSNSKEVVSEIRAQADQPHHGVFEIRGDLIGMNYRVRTQSEALQAYIRAERPLTVQDWSKVQTLYQANGIKHQGCALVVTKAQFHHGDERYYFDLSEVRLPRLVRSAERGQEMIDL